MSDSYDDTYTESQVIMTAVKIIAPFTLTYGLFMTFHGGDAPGGGFQGGTIVGVTVLMIAFAFGIEPTRRWLRNSLLVGLVTGGVVIFGVIGLAMIVLGGDFLEFYQLKEVFHIKPKWGLEAVEIGGIALIVSGVIITLFFAMAAGFTPERPSGTGGHSGRQRPTDREVDDDD
ncbi:MnhB domain-containing protein [Natronorubrum thiooxidans]|uniref:Multisubunit sodium/proton antiporter, MrpB subunit n=1 Tax=Natronorubrum thiooxidans TaxID=308853 RepID=A0A1N7FNZ8_9EURY|nr:MnhB domain-containing protein [Natronorubrum thiooxidans]SIS02017.1 multisubunit sodium/proton antiporter, MrpB subunit [Natronorubrum thiooxidans]